MEASYLIFKCHFLCFCFVFLYNVACNESQISLRAPINQNQQTASTDIDRDTLHPSPRCSFNTAAVVYGTVHAFLKGSAVVKASRT